MCFLRGGCKHQAKLAIFWVKNKTMKTRTKLTLDNCVHSRPPWHLVRPSARRRAHLNHSDRVLMSDRTSHENALNSLFFPLLVCFYSIRRPSPQGDSPTLWALDRYLSLAPAWCQCQRVHTGLWGIGLMSSLCLMWGFFFSSYNQRLGLFPKTPLTKFHHLLRAGRTVFTPGLPLMQTSICFPGASASYTARQDKHFDASSA